MSSSTTTSFSYQPCYHHMFYICTYNQCKYSHDQKVLDAVPDHVYEQKEYHYKLKLEVKITKNILGEDQKELIIVMLKMIKIEHAQILKQLDMMMVPY